VAFFEEFKKFAMRGNVVDLAVAVVIGGAFGPIIKSAVDDLIMPPVGILVGNVDFKNLFVVLKAPPAPVLDKDLNMVHTLEAIRSGGGVVFAYGSFINAIFNFLIVSFAIFLLVKGMNTLAAKEEAAAPPPPSTKDCPLCCSAIPLAARRCGHCTADLPAKGGA
jgi:large conductance mechanosensitive channel